MIDSTSDVNQELISALDNLQNINIGDKVTGEILTIDENEAVIGIDGAGIEGVLTAKEFSNDKEINLKNELNRGDKLDLIVVSRLNPSKDNGSFLLSKKRIEDQKAWEDLRSDFDNNARFNVLVTETVKNGLLVNVKGIRGFIPASLISTKFVKDLEPYVGKTLEVEISDIDKSKNRLVLNHRIIEEEQDREIRNKVIERLLPGDEITGKVTRLAKFGAFIDVGGIDGLVHISELSYNHVNDPSDMVNMGDEVKVRVLNADKESGKISLSIKALQQSPWDKFIDETSVGDILTGKVNKLTNFGAFVEVFPGVEGLVHISEISWDHIKVPSDVLSVGQDLEVKVINIDNDKKRLGLSIKQLSENPNQDELTEANNFEIPEESHGFNLSDVVKNDK